MRTSPGGVALDRTAVVLHWVIALAVIGMIAFGTYLGNLPDDEAKLAVFPFHAGIGLTILVIAALRLGRRLRLGFPEPAGDHARWQRRAARIVHWVLLLSTLVMPLSGIVLALGKGFPVSIFGLVTLGQIEADKTIQAIGERMHGLTATVIFVALLLHVAAALKHHFRDRDRTLKRMLGR